MNRPMGLMSLAALTSCALAMPAAAQQEPPERSWWRDAVFYQIFVRSFADSSQGPWANDGKGDFQGLIDRLDWLNDGNPDTDHDLGITAIWLLPINESETYHGYDIEDYADVDAELGDRELFRRFVQECEQRGIRVVIDWVVNHSSWKHPWFVEAIQPGSDKRDWYTFADPRPDFRGPWGQHVWHERVRPTAGASYYGVFSPTMPDLNLANPQVTTELHNAATHWLADQKIAGFRLDAIKYLIEHFPDQLENTTETLDWLRSFREHVHAVKPGGYTVGEVWDSSEVVHRYIRHGSVDSAFEFDLSFRIFDAINTHDAVPLRQQIDKLARMYPPEQGGAVYATFLSNHDQTRTRTRLGGSIEKSALAASLLMTLPGTPYIYYGEELGMTGDKPDPDLRTPKPWSIDEPHAGFTLAESPWRAITDDPREVSVQAADLPGGLREHYRALIRLRHALPALRSDAIRTLDLGDARVLAYIRSHDQSRVLILANLSDEPIPLDGLRIDALQPTPPARWQILHGPAISDALPPTAAVVIQLPD